MYFLTFLIKNLTRRKTRSLLTILGVAVAVGTMVTLRGISYGFESSFVESFQHRGTDIVVVAAGQADQLRSDLDEKICEQLQHIPGVKTAWPGLLEMIDITRGTSVSSALIHGWRPNTPLFDDLTLLDGRSLQKGDPHEVLLGTTLASTLNKKVGDTIEMQQEQFRVVGIFRSFNVYENGGVVIALDELQRLMDRKGRVTGFSVVLEPAEDRAGTVERVCKEIETLKDEQGRPYKIMAQESKQYVSGTLYIQLAHGMAWITSAIAAFIGAISMLNTMITSVLERIKEIGILRAMGWRKGRVVRMILGESMLLSIAGGVVGVLGAVLVTRWLATVPEVNGFVRGDVSPVIMMQGFVTALVVALVGGTYPAYRAAHWLPTEALRHE